MNLNVTIDWKFVVALGTAAVGVIFAVKMDGAAAERVSTHAVDACKGSMRSLETATASSIYDDA